MSLTFKEKSMFYCIYIEHWKCSSNFQSNFDFSLKYFFSLKLQTKIVLYIFDSTTLSKFIVLRHNILAKLSPLIISPLTFQLFPKSLPTTKFIFKIGKASFEFPHWNVKPWCRIKVPWLESINIIVVCCSTS